MGSLVQLLLCIASWYSRFSLDHIVSLLSVAIFLLSLPTLMFFHHYFLSSSNTASLFSSFNLLLSCISLMDSDTIPFVVKEYC